MESADFRRISRRSSSAKNLLLSESAAFFASSPDGKSAENPPIPLINTGSKGWIQEARRLEA
jgi:hypothetical protein